MNRLAYFLLTSAKLTRSGWGVPSSKHHVSRSDTENEMYMRSYEVGVLFIPKFFDEDYFEVQETKDRNNKKLFPFMFNLPLVPYETEDVPWLLPARSRSPVNESEEDDFYMDLNLLFNNN